LFAENKKRIKQTDLQHQRFTAWFDKTSVWQCRWLS